MSPRPAAPSRASVTACSTTSASLWPARPRGCSMRTPPRISGRPSAEAVRVVTDADAKHELKPYSRSRNSSSVKPASRTMPPIVKALTGLCRGITTLERSVRHDDVLALPKYPEAGFFQSTHRIQVIDARNLRHG